MKPSLGVAFALLSDQASLAKIRRAARTAMGASSNSPPGRTIAVTQNKVVRRELMGGILPFRCQALCEMDHGRQESVRPFKQPRAAAPPDLHRAEHPPRAAGVARPAPAPPPEIGHWYYCRTSKGYYPYVKDCPVGWEKVSPLPPGQR